MLVGRRYQNRDDFTQISEPTSQVAVARGPWSIPMYKYWCSLYSWISPFHAWMTSTIDGFLPTYEWFDLFAWPIFQDLRFGAQRCDILQS